MNWNCLIVDLVGPCEVRASQLQDSGQQLSLEPKFLSNLEEAIITLNTGCIAAMVVFCEQFDDGLEALLKSFQDKVGCIPESQMIFIDDPMPRFIVSVFEFGVEQFASPSNWIVQTYELCQKVLDVISDDQSTEAKNLALYAAMRAGDKSRISELGGEIEAIASYDYRAAFARARAFEANGQYADALGEYSSASALNKMFRPAATSKGQTLLLAGKIDEAIEIFQRLEKSNPRDVNRKANLASAYLEKGDIESAQQYLAEGEMLAPLHPRLIETRAQICLSTGKIGEAFQLMDQMSEVGPFFAAKLNEIGIRLSQAGKGKNALALYQKAHKIVRSELRYKISLNAALACRRLGEFEMALKYIIRCRKEFGGNFEKLAKIEESVKAMMMQNDSVRLQKTS